LGDGAGPFPGTERFIPNLPGFDVSGGTVFAVECNRRDVILPVLVGSGAVRVQIVGGIAGAGQIDTSFVIGMRRRPSRGISESIEDMLMTSVSSVQPGIQNRPVIDALGGIELLPVGR
jgi:hypothetical protein